MSGWNQPENHQEEENVDTPHKRKMPDFIYVDTDRATHSPGYERVREEFAESLETMQRQQYPFIARIICLVTSLFLIIMLFLAIPFLCIFFFANLITFFHFTPFWEQTKKLWKTVKKSAVTMIGLAIAAFSPALGFSIMIVYFLMHGQSVDDQFITRIMKTHFDKR